MQCTCIDGLGHCGITAYRDVEAKGPGCYVIIFENAEHCVNMDVPKKFNSACERL